MENQSPPNGPKKPGGFSYNVSREQLDDYRSWPQERRLQWLLYGNILRKHLPAKTIAIQDKFRAGKL